MSTFKTDEQNNLIINSNTFEIASGKEGALLKSKHYARTLRGEMMHDITKGVRFFETAFDRPRPKLLRADILSRIKQVPDIKDVISLDVSIGDGKINYVANINTLYGAGGITDVIV